MASFFSRVQSAQSAISGNRAAVAKRAQWQSRGTRYLRAHRGKSGAWIQTDPAFHGTVLTMLGEAAPAVADAINRHLVPVAERAFDDWPVSTGLSRSMLALEFERAGDGILITHLRSNAPYSWFIHRGDAAKKLIFDAGLKAVDAMREDIGATLAGGRNAGR